ncbi:MAG: hypothetical protein Q9209_001806 [Squamulea sp. 1 TL-2023]
MAASFAEATTVKALDSHTYQGHFQDEWCIGNELERNTVPHGGFVTSCFLSATSLHFSTTHAARNQPHTITLQLTFLRRTSIGPALFTIRDVKLGRRTSTVHVSLTQHDDPEPCVVGYLTQSNLFTEEGISLPTNWSLHPPPLPLLSTHALQTDKDPNYTRLSPHRISPFRKAAQRTEFYLPRRGQLAPAMADEWLRFSSGERFMQNSLGFVVDQFPQIVEVYPGMDPSVVFMERKGEAVTKLKWYPTVLLNLEVKKALPEEGVEWLFVRVRAKRIVNGRMDLEVTVLDEGGDLVAVSNHVCLILGAERNLRRSGMDTSKM